MKTVSLTVMLVSLLLGLGCLAGRHQSPPGSFSDPHNRTADAARAVSSAPRGGAGQLSANPNAAHQAIEEGDAAALQDLIDNGMAVDAADGAGRTLLHYAIERGQSDIAECLLNRGADPNRADRYGFVPLCQCLFAGGNAEKVANTVGLLLSHGANANASCELPVVGGRVTALQLSLREGYEAAAARLIEAGADVNAEGAEGLTALMVAASQGELSSVRLLMQEGAKLDAAGQNGATALDLAEESGHGEVAALLRDAGARPGKKALASHRRAPQSDQKARLPSYNAGLGPPLAYVSITKDADKVIADLPDQNTFVCRRFRLIGADVSDEGIEALVRKYSDIDLLDLCRTRITDQALVSLTHSRTLAALDISDTPVSAEGLNCLPMIPGVRVLGLCGLEIGDAQIEVLLKMPKLEAVAVSGEKSTQDGLDKLRRRGVRVCVDSRPKELVE
ncbi:MAG: ankyrin repeat domain-containing protein [Candidatus Sumerlaeota bacterium]|nr:ankyrin repeat domain-containing protein [Candidatus Sumerlaeota bacterium]